MKTDNRDSEKDLNANPDSELNTNKPITEPDRFPESPEAREEMKRREVEKREMEKREMEKREQPDPNRAADLELLAGDVSGNVSSRSTGSNPEDIAGVSDLDRGMRRGKRR